MAFINNVYVDDTGTGDIQTTLQAVAADDVFLGGFRFRNADGHLRVNEAGVVVSNVGPFGFDANGALCIEDAAGVAASEAQGCSFTATGNLLCSIGGVNGSNVGGWPFNAAGRLLIDTLP